MHRRTSRWARWAACGPRRESRHSTRPVSGSRAPPRARRAGWATAARRRWGAAATAFSTLSGEAGTSTVTRRDAERAEGRTAALVAGVAALAAARLAAVAAAAEGSRSTLGTSAKDPARIAAAATVAADVSTAESIGKALQTFRAATVAFAMGSLPRPPVRTTPFRWRCRAPWYVLPAAAVTFAPVGRAASARSLPAVPEASSRAAAPSPPRRSTPQRRQSTAPLTSPPRRDCVAAAHLLQFLAARVPGKGARRSSPAGASSEPPPSHGAHALSPDGRAARATAAAPARGPPRAKSAASPAQLPGPLRRRRHCCPEERGVLVAGLAAALQAGGSGTASSRAEPGWPAAGHQSALPPRKPACAPARHRTRAAPVAKAVRAGPWSASLQRAPRAEPRRCCGAAARSEARVRTRSSARAPGTSLLRKDGRGCTSRRRLPRAPTRPRRGRRANC
mmetsp:Transcript_36730/g.109389  ORF Transcript_36730/g.109389 Transcript_36730/m.109389 type:complete len:450 (-) Transcript_36730:587-1936(-)